MATKMKQVDAVLVGMGWTGSIMARELTKAGLTVVGLERHARQIGLDAAQRADPALFGDDDGDRLAPATIRALVQSPHDAADGECRQDRAGHVERMLAVFLRVRGEPTSEDERDDDEDERQGEEVRQRDRHAALEPVARWLDELRP